MWVKLKEGTRSLRLAWKIDRASLLQLLLLTAVSAVLPLAIAYVGKLIIDTVVARALVAATRYVLLEAALVALQATSQRGLGLMRTVLGSKLTLEINCLIVGKAASLQLPQMESSEVHDKLNRAGREANSRPTQILVDTSQIIQNVLTLLGYLGLLYAYTPLAVVVLLVSALPATAAEMRFSNQSFRLHHWHSLNRRRFFYLENLLINEMFAKEVRALNLGGLFLGRHRALGERLHREDKELHTRRAGWATLLSFVALASFYGFYLIIVRNAARGLLSLGNLTLYVVALRQGQQAFQSCLSSLGAMYEHGLYMSNLFEFLAIPTARAAAAPAIARSGRVEDGILFESVSFRYPGQGGWALRDITLRLRPGESVALIGLNGAGKTTLTKLLCRLYEPTEGRILLDGRDLREWPAPDLLRRLSVVFQDFNRYHLTLGENVAIGDVSHLDEEDRILRAIEDGGARDIFQMMPEGLGTQLGRNFDGSELSGGQWQRIALARVFMKSTADILILDEPTAALDPQAEYNTLQLFRDLTRDKTSILISHHFPVARIAARIIVLEGGRILEDGSHEGLLAAGGRYAHLFSLQAQGYA